MIDVEVMFSPAPREVCLVAISLPEGSTLADAVRASGLVERFGLPPSGGSVGIWGRRRSAETIVRTGDRVEIYRTLKVDPKEARRQRYRGQRAKAAPKEKRPAGAGR
jgi:putative ubiquitin-RnfH superfamily antitoxin RatB of RatAB toxin-antitoxin module